MKETEYLFSDSKFQYFKENRKGMVKALLRKYGSFDKIPEAIQGLIRQGVIKD